MMWKTKSMAQICYSGPFSLAVIIQVSNSQSDMGCLMFDYFLSSLSDLSLGVVLVICF